MRAEGILVQPFISTGVPFVHKSTVDHIFDQKYEFYCDYLGGQREGERVNGNCCIRVCVTMSSSSISSRLYISIFGSSLACIVFGNIKERSLRLSDRPLALAVFA